VKLDKKRQEISKHNYYLTSPRVPIEAIIITLHGLAVTPHPRPPTLMNKLRIQERMCTSCGECVHKYVHWCQKHPCSVRTCTCSRNLFSAYHTHHNKCTYNRAGLLCRQCNHFFAMKTPMRNILNLVNFFPFFGKQKSLSKTESPKLCVPLKISTVC